MAKSKKSKRAKAVKKFKKLSAGKKFAVVLVLLIVCAVVAYFYRDQIKAYIDGNKNNSQTAGDILTDELSIHFLEVGNKYTGDCTLIKVGDTEILIDAGSRKGSAATIVPYVQQYCTDGVLEYVIATHAHQDHIAGFVGTTTADGV